MFKKGQLLRSKITGRMMVVLSWPTIRTTPTGTVFRMTHNEVELIGNNYQAKQK